MKYFIDPELGRIPMLDELDDEIDEAAIDQVISNKLAAVEHPADE